MDFTSPRKHTLALPYQQRSPAGSPHLSPPSSFAPSKAPTRPSPYIMGVQQSLLDAFASANVSSASGTRFLKVTIENEQAVLALSVPSRGSADADFALVEEKAELKTNEAAYIIFKLDGSGGWCFITFVSLAVEAARSRATAERSDPRASPASCLLSF